MKISNKFNIGDVVYYPAADLRSARILKAEITGIVVRDNEGKTEVIYQTGQSYGVSPEDVFKTQRPAKRRLIRILEEKREEIAKEIDEAISKINEMDIKELVFDITAKDEEPQETEETTEPQN